MSLDFFATAFIHALLGFRVTVSFVLLISAPRGIYYFLSLTLSVPMSVHLSVMPHQIESSLSFLDGIEPFFGRHFSVWHSTKRCSSIFDLGPLTPKNWL